MRSIFHLFYTACLAMLILSACNPTKYVPKDEYLLRQVEIEVDNKNIKKEQLKTYIKQKPNKKIIGMRFHLWLFNRSKEGKDNNWNNWLRNNGEEPVLWQQNMTNKSKEQLTIYLESKGYYYSEITDTAIFRNKKADIIYRINTGWPYVINSVGYSIPDSAVKRLILADTVNSLIHKDVIFDVAILENELKRIETKLKNLGYYSFSKDYITFDVDTMHNNRTVSLELKIKSHTQLSENNQVIESPYPLYSVSSLIVNASLDIRNIIDAENAPRSNADTIAKPPFSFIMPRKFPVKPSTISQSLFIFPDSLYRLSNVNQTYQHLSDLRNFKQVNIEFKESPGQTNLMMREIDCYINLLPFTRQSYDIQLEGTNSGGNLGGALNFNYQNKSLFNHAEIFDLRLRGMLEAVQATNETFKFGNTLELEAEASINIPKFLLPFRSERFIRQYNPKTIFSILYNFQRRPYYTRNVFSTSFGYNWKGSEIIRHVVRPLDANFILLPEESLDKDFKAMLERYPYLKNSYQSHMVVSSNYSFVRDMRLLGKESFFYIRTNFETAGLLLNSVFRLTDKSGNKPYKIAGNAFSQFVKADFDISYYYTINSNNTLVSRIFAGVGWPYGNSVLKVMDPETSENRSIASMPFEKKYYSGGANSVRGWRLRDLGPGSFSDKSDTLQMIYPNNTGDIKLEANIEYRFKLVWVLEGALFIDVGNVWDSREDKERPGANFRFNRFYKEIAMSGGIGFRFDFKFFILRFDLGMKMHDPSYREGQRWIFNKKDGMESRITSNDFCFSVAINYPF